MKKQILIKNIKEFGTYNLQGVHQIVESDADIENAVYNAERDGFNRIIFYVSYPANWMTDFDFRTLIKQCKNATN